MQGPPDFPAALFLCRFTAPVAGDILVVQINEQEMIIRTTGNQFITIMDQGSTQGLRILHDLLLVGDKLLRHRLFEADCLGSNNVH